MAASLILPLLLLWSSCRSEFENSPAVDAALGSGGNGSTPHYVATWIEDGRLKPHARSLLADLCRTEQYGLVSWAYSPESLVQALERFAKDQNASNAAELDSQLTSAFTRYSGDLLRGRVDPKELASEMYLTGPEVSADSVMMRILSGQAPESIRSLLAPNHPGYLRLDKALAGYRALAEKGGWPRIASGDVIKPGERDARVPNLRHRLAITGDLDENQASDNSLYDADVQAALAHFQRRHGIDVDSALGPATLEALNVPVEDRIRQIQLTLERWHWLPRRLGERYVIVNIPAFLVHAYVKEDLVLTMRAVVGSELKAKQTPVFSDMMDYVVFRPYWNVPQEIAINEILPKVEEDESYLQDNRYELIDDEGQVVDSDDPDLDKVESGTYRVRQLPGPANALGLVKFIFPNEHNVYLHDSPADHLFDESARDFSHGCIRLEDPARFAEFVLGPQGWTSAAIQSALRGERKQVELETPIPVYIVYLSAFVLEDGTVSFRNDIYGLDEALDGALKKYNEPALEQAGPNASSCERIHNALDEL
ncbi:MAG TPA: L,D-transpeptidase family protein [Rhodothermales bacterium]|nr:L,D-transpeptidase family protein [Rhodothermales bacterium]